MKQAILALAALTISIGTISQAFAYDNHHRVCHKVRYHNHLVTRCH